ncbi:NAD(P)/FAD-dependent oxidoreductase [Frankia sp. R82]|uniref:NAD(P)/FAD-dependent oxidoreductase n=1 Tax=Frankia sp. R82 TaxID=2950553 RepID=UPI002043EE1E|nr:NAD(P)/FAD-dependent oxidoreductase [Frankia sp. R82]MCM3883222.1 NAD(P)/FAD-dependent oxidoreductase [Frankia sp. R82]
MYDVIVVGARCAGSPLAMLLARAGRKVLLVDRATFPSDTISTHFIQQTGLALLRDWGLLEAAVGNARPIRYMTLSFKGISISGFADPIDGIDAVYAPRRTVMDVALVEAAQAAGVEFRAGYMVEALVFDDEGRVVGIRGRTAAGAVSEDRARVVVGADGSNSTVARLAGAATYRHLPASCFIYYSYFAGLPWESFHHRTGHDEQQMGTWPTNDELNLVAVMRKRSRFQEFRSAAEANFQQVVDQITPELGDDLRQAERVAPLQAMLYPDNYYRQASGPGWALVGDAGYHKDPYTGNGIADAFRHAAMLSRALLSGLDENDDVLGAALRGYGHRRDEESAETYDFTCTISELDLPQDIYDAFDASSRAPRYRTEFFRLLAGAMPGHEFFAPERLTRMYREVGFQPTVEV